jgi:DNA polymerase-3 subunit alpha
MKTYTVFHLHDEHSNCNGYYDSITPFKEYLKLAKAQNMNAIALSNHGNIFEWVQKKQACDKLNIKYIHGIETYMDIIDMGKQSFHIGLYAKNYDGVMELNRLASKSTLKDGHFYKTPRIYFSELKQTSKNIIITTACLQSALWQLRKFENFTNEILEFLSSISDRSFLEIQYHNHIEQIEYNKLLLSYSKKYKIPLIAGTDTHSANSYYAECRKILQKSNNSYYGNEDSFDLTWKTYDELIECFKQQNSIPEIEFLKAIENTNVLANMVEPFELNYEFKYPGLYKNPKEKFLAAVDRNYKTKLNKGIIKENQEYIDRQKEELEAIEKQGMESFLYFMHELVEYCKKNNIIYGRCRGSVGGSLIAYILDIIDLDPIKFKTIFSRFCNADRISLADIDIDFAPEDRGKIYKYIINRFTTRNTAYISQFGKLKDRGTLDVLGRGLDMPLDEIKIIKDEYETLLFDYKKIIQESINLEEHKIENDIDNHEKFVVIINDIIIIAKLNILYDNYIKLKEKYKDVFYYFDGLKNTIISKGNHPAGIIGSPIDLIQHIGVWYKDGDENFPVSVCSMKPIESLNFCKFDILGLKMMGIIKDTYKDIGIKYHKSHEMNWEDKNIFDEIIQSKVGCFQFEGEYAFEQLKKFKPRNIFDITLVTAAIRPSGASYRDKLLNREFNRNPSKEIDELLVDNYGYIVYQEDTIKFLQQFCGFSGSEADTIRRAIGKKLLDVIKDNTEKITKGYQSTLKKDFETAKKEITEFLKMLINASRYQFGYNHALGYTLNTCTGIYLRHYHPVSFVKSYLNRADKNEDYVDGFNLAQLKGIKIESICFKYSYGKYIYDENTKTMYKGLKSVKYINNISDEILNDLYNQKYQNISDVFERFLNHFNKKQIGILIDLNYFKNFGNPNYLTECFKIFQKYFGKKQFKKDALLEIEKTWFEKIPHKKTDKLYKGFDSKDLINYIIKNALTKKSYDYFDLLKKEFEYFGYVHTKLKAHKDLVMVLDIKIKNSVRVHVCYVNSGVHKTYTIYKNKFYKHQNYDNIYFNPRFKIFDLIYIKSIETNKYGTFLNSFMF